LEQTSHGVPSFGEVKIFLEQNFKKTPQRISFLSAYLTRDQIEWVKIKDQMPLWDSEQKKTENKFHFLQGDVIETTRVDGLGRATTLMDHNLWLILSPDCDCARGDYIRVAPIFTVNSKIADEYADHKENLSLAFKLKSNRLFPVGGDLFEDGMDGYYCDSTEPYFLRAEIKDSVTVHFSMPEEGWHLLNAFLKESETRANIVEGVAVRRASASNVVALVPPAAKPS